MRLEALGLARPVFVGVPTFICICRKSGGCGDSGGFPRGREHSDGLSLWVTRDAKPPGGGVRL